MNNSYYLNHLNNNYLLLTKQLFNMVHIKKVKINGFLSFNDFKITLNKSLNIIVGTNGTGKTNLFKLINAALHFDEMKNDLIKSLNGDMKPSICIDLVLDDNERAFFNNMYIIWSMKDYCNLIDQRCEAFMRAKDQIGGLNILQSTIIRINYTYENGDIISTWRTVPDEESDMHCKHNLITDTNICAHQDCGVNCQSKKLLDRFKTELQIIYTKFPDHINITEEQFMKRICKENLLNFHNNLNFTRLTSKFNKSTICSHEELTVNDIPRMEKLLRSYVSSSIHAPSFSYVNIEIFIDQVKRITNMFGDPNKHKCDIDKSLRTINMPYDIRKIVFEIKNKNRKTFKSMQKWFKEITDKKFDVELINDNDAMLDDYRYVIIDNYTECSRGEYELINFLADYCSDQYPICFIDEPCTHLSSQNKVIFREKLFSQTTNLIGCKQMFLITHDKELIDKSICKNIIHFGMNNNRTTHVCFSNMHQSKVKLVSEHPEMLFSRQILLVEGFTDYIFFKEFLTVHNMSNYNIIYTDGCGSKLWEIADEIGVKYKMIYDIDKICKTKEDVDECNNIAIEDRKS